MIKIKNLGIEFSRYNGSFRKEKMQVLSSIDLSAEDGEIVGIVGSSGSGKSLLAHAILGILPSNVKITGEIIFKGEPLTEKRKRKLRGKEIGLIPQSVSYLNPLCSTHAHIKRAGKLCGIEKRSIENEVDILFTRFNLEDKVKKYFPFQISGGMARKVLTAASTIGEPDLLIADEPTTGLDTDAVDKSLNHLKKLAGLGKTILLITHDISAALKICDRIAVIYSGTTLEIAKPSDFNGSKKLRHPYSEALWQSLPQNSFTFVPGEQPLAGSIEEGCPFHPRCSKNNEICCCKKPELRSLNEGFVRCHHA